LVVLLVVDLHDFCGPPVRKKRENEGVREGGREGGRKQAK
jgi:hypothetical protein